MRKVLNYKVLLSIVVVLLVANIVLILYMAKMRPPGRGFGGIDRQRSPISTFLKKDIGFDDQQMKAVDQLRQQHWKSMRSLIEDIRLAKVRFYGLLNNADINDSVLSRAAAVIGEKQKALELRTFQNFRELRGLSTAAQRPVYDSLIPGVIGKMWFPEWKGNPRIRKDSANANH